MATLSEEPARNFSVHRRCSSDTLCLPSAMTQAVTPVQRWDGHAREATDWNDLRRDPELFFSHGDTLIYLYSQGRSQRGPSFRIPCEILLYSECRPLVERSLISTYSSSPYRAPETNLVPAESYLYLHAPSYLSREESFDYHMTTRNFFAWLMGVPIIGYDPASALIALKERMDIWRDEGSDNLRSISQYVADQGYGDISELEPQIPQETQPVLFAEITRTFDPNVQPTLVPGPRRRASGLDLARNSLRRMSQTFQQSPHIPDFVRSRKSMDQLRSTNVSSTTIAPNSGDLATIAYSDTVADTPPSTTTRTPRSKTNRTIGRNSVYTEIYVPDYGNGYYHQAYPAPELSTTQTSEVFDPTTTSTVPSSPDFLPTNALPTSIPTSAFKHLPASASSRPASIHSTISQYSADSDSNESAYSTHSPIPSLSSSYSTTPSLSDGETAHHDSDSTSNSAPATPTTPSFSPHMELPTRKRPLLSEEFWSSGPGSPCWSRTRSARSGRGRLVLMRF